MSSSPQHLEVVPRIIDEGLSSSYKPSVKKEEDAVSEQQAIDPIVAASAVVHKTVSSSFFSKLKEYLMPAIFMVCLIIVVYILWKYFTKYRSNINKPISQVPQQAILGAEDLSKYTAESETESEAANEHESEDESEDEVEDDKLSAIEECSETSSVISIEKFNQVEEDPPSLDMSTINQLIEENMYDDMPVLQDDSEEEYNPDNVSEADDDEASEADDEEEEKENLFTLTKSKPKTKKKIKL
jgi:hypothetical protein